MAVGNKTDRDRKEKKRFNMGDWANKQQQPQSQIIRLPEGYEFFTLKPGDYLVDFMQYRCGPGNKDADEGYPSPQFSMTVHAIPGPDGGVRNYCCRAAMLGERCPACKFHQSEQSDVAKAMYPKIHQAWIVNDNPGPKKKLTKANFKVLMQPYKMAGNSGFGQMITDVMKAKPRFHDFFEPDGKHSVELTIKETAMGEGRKFNKITRFDFVPRDYQYDEEEVLDLAPCLDQCVIVLSYEEMHKLIYQEDTPTRMSESSSLRKPKQEEPDDDEGDEEEEEAPPRKSGKKLPTAKECGLRVGDYVMYQPEDNTEELECKIIKISGDGTSLTLEDENENDHRGVAPNEVKKVKLKDSHDEDEEEEEEEEKPAPKKRGRPAKNHDDDDDDFDPDEENDDDEDEDDSPPPKKRGRPAKQQEEDDDDDDPDSELEEDEDEEEEEKPAPKKRGRPAKKKDEDDDD